MMTNFITVMRRFALSFLLIVFPFTACIAEETDSIEMADALLSNGKIYVVVTVLSLIFAGITIYLIRLDKRISKMERERKS
jgi:CcmD family protein